MRRPLDGGAQIGFVHRTEQVQAALDQPGELRVRRNVTQPVGAQRHHQRAALGVRDERGEEPRPFAGVVASVTLLRTGRRPAPAPVPTR